MVKHLVKNFLSEPHEYQLAVKYWHDRCRQILHLSGKQNQWKPWLNTHFLNGTSFFDGNPIYSLVSEEKRKGLRIVQEEPTTDEVEISAWMDTYGDSGNGFDGSIKELVIVCALSKESMKVASALIKPWLVENPTDQEMENLIRRLIPS